MLGLQGRGVYAMHNVSCANRNCGLSACHRPAPASLPRADVGSQMLDIVVGYLKRVQGAPTGTRCTFKSVCRNAPCRNASPPPY